MWESLWKTQGPMAVRYLLMTIAGALFTHGVTSPEQNAYISGNMDVLVGLLIGLATWAWGIWRKPSPAAMEAAKQIDNVVIPLNKSVGAPTITIKTPIGKADIEIPMPMKKVA